MPIVILEIFSLPTHARDAFNYLEVMAHTLANPHISWIGVVVAGVIAGWLTPPMNNESKLCKLAGYTFLGYRSLYIINFYN